MSRLSEAGENLLGELIVWEVFGSDSDPRLLIRQLSLADLCIAISKIPRLKEGHGPLYEMLQLEERYRRGELVGWWVETDGRKINLHYSWGKEELSGDVLHFEREDGDA